MNKSNDPFFQVEMTQKDSTHGKIDLPALYYDVYNVISFYLVDKKAVEEKLEDTPFKLAIKFGNKALVAISYYQYNETSVGSYNEVGLAIPVMLKGEKRPFFGSLLNIYSKMRKRKVGFYILNLPVAHSKNQPL